MKALLRSSVRRLAHFVSARPVLVNVASRTFDAFPSLKRRLRGVISGANRPPTRREAEMTPEEARVLVDLREALAARQRPPR